MINTTRITKTHTEIVPKRIWQRITISAITMTLAALTIYIVFPISSMLNVNIWDLQGANLKYTWRHLLIIFGHAFSQFLLIYIINKFFHKRSFSSFGFRKPILKPMLLGILIGFIFTGIYKIIILLNSGNPTITWAVPDGTPARSIIFYFLFFQIFLLTINSLIEELVFRVYPLEQFMDKTKHMVIVIILISLFFSGVHNIVQPFYISSFINRFLVALLLSFTYYHWRSIWFISGIHTGTNIVYFLFTGKWKTGGLWVLSYTRPSELFDVIIYASMIFITMIILNIFRPRRRTNIIQ